MSLKSVFIYFLYLIGIVLHEMLHTMGFYHEMQRGDRNKFMEIIPKNVQKGIIVMVLLREEGE